MYILINFHSFRTITNISLLCDDDDSMDFTDDTSSDFLTKHTSKRPKKSNNEQLRIFESIAQDMKESQSKKIEIFQQIMHPKSELELFFASICKTVEKFGALEQAKTKVAISQIVSQMEISHLEKAAQEIIFLPSPNGKSFTIDISDEQI